MYRVVNISDADRSLHRFLWRAKPEDPIVDHEMTRVTFGVASSPYLAVKCLQQTAKDFRADHKLASYHVVQSFYVDDCLAGADTSEAALALCQGLREILAQGGFNLCKIRSSHSSVINAIDPFLREKLPVKGLVDQHACSYPKALGLEWDSVKDTMSTALNLDTASIPTKRGIIADIARTLMFWGG